jgi:hypothetical protein
MLTVPKQLKIFVSLQPTDMRRGFPGLSGEVQSTLEQDPLSGHLFLFRNRRRDRIKILYWDGGRLRDFLQAAFSRQLRVSGADRPQVTRRPDPRERVVHAAGRHRTEGTQAALTIRTSALSKPPVQAAFIV